VLALDKRSFPYQEGLFADAEPSEPDPY
jgi:hypothetical protein